VARLVAAQQFGDVVEQRRMSQRPANSKGGSRNTPTPTPEPTPNPEPFANRVAFDTLRFSGDDPEPVDADPVSALVDGRVPVPVLRQWSDALAAAGLFVEALQVHPGAERADVVRRAELAVLAEDHHAALTLLAELAAASTARTLQNPAGLPAGIRSRSQPLEAGSPWLELLTACARVQAGQHDLLPAVMTAAQRVQPSAGVSWVVALAAVAVGDLAQAAPAAVAARAGGCRDLRILAVSAADRAVDGDDWAAIELLRGAQRVALPDEDPAGLAVTLLDNAGFRDEAQRLSARAATDTSLSAPARAAWKAAARGVGAGHKQMFRRSMAAVGGIGTRRRENGENRRRAAASTDLTCRCYGSTGWIGENRVFYVARHLNQVLPAPVAGLQARLVRCRATKQTFLDFPERQFTLPVVSEVSPDGRAVRVDQFADPAADPEARPTPGMGVSLGMALPA
jgi:hypothetical protein